MKAVLFINGEPPTAFPDPGDYAICACTDGALDYLQALNFPLEKITFVCGDFDSKMVSETLLEENKFIYTPDQNKTDFHKSLELLQERGVTEIDVYGGSGREMDHFLGNLTVACQFKEVFKITFTDEYSNYYFIPRQYKINGVKGKMLSLYPFPEAKNITTTGLNWLLNDEDLSLTHRVGTRNFAIDNQVTINYRSGDLLLFVGKNPFRVFEENK